MDYTVRNANLEDLEAIQAIYRQARQFMAQTGNPNQWGTTHPPLEKIRQDIQTGNLYVLTSGQNIHGVFAFFLGEDPTYQVIRQGHWRSHAPYGTIHTIAGDGSGGIVKTAVAFAAGKSAYLRIDTHPDNHVMQKALARAGFQPCGRITVADGTERIAYDRLG